MEDDGSYDCLFCGDSVRGMPALVCWECISNPWHRTCEKDLKHIEVCPTCNRKSVKARTGASARITAPSEIIDLTRAGVAERAMLSGSSSKVIEPGVSEAGPEAWGEGAATRRGRPGSLGRGRGDKCGSWFEGRHG